MGLNMHLVGWVVLCIIACVVAFYAAGRAHGLYHQPKAGAEKTWNSDFDPGVYRDETVVNVHDVDPSASTPLMGNLRLEENGRVLRITEGATGSSNKFTLPDANSEAASMLNGKLLDEGTILIQDGRLYQLYSDGFWRLIQGSVTFYNHGVVESDTKKRGRLQRQVHAYHEKYLKRK